MLQLPPLLQELIEAGRWPRTNAEALAQNLRPIVALERIRLLAAEESSLYLNAPPFHTVRALSAHDSFWFEPSAVPGEIDFDLALTIGDFGLGSDAPILLDYRPSLTRPRVIRLRWSSSSTQENRWVTAADDFESFVGILQL